jgi:hypothetical protein
MTEAKVPKRKLTKRKRTQKVKPARPARKFQLSEKQEEAEARQGYRSGELERRFGFKT